MGERAARAKRKALKQQADGYYAGLAKDQAKAKRAEESKKRSFKVMFLAVSTFAVIQMAFNVALLIYLLTSL